MIYFKGWLLYNSLILKALVLSHSSGSFRQTTRIFFYPWPSNWKTILFNCCTIAVPWTNAFHLELLQVKDLNNQPSLFQHGRGPQCLQLHTYNSTKALLPQILKNISQKLASTKRHNKYDHIMNIRSESDYDRGHKPSKLIHTGWRNTICPAKDIKIIILPW